MQATRFQDRDFSLTQERDYRENEVLPAKTLERNFDKLTMQVQQLAEKSALAVTVDIFDDTDAASLIPSIRQAVICHNVRSMQRRTGDRKCFIKSQEEGGVSSFLLHVIQCLFQIIDFIPYVKLMIADKEASFFNEIGIL